MISKPVEAVSRHVPEYHVCTNGLNNSVISIPESTHTIPRSSEIFETSQNFHIDFPTFQIYSRVSCPQAPGVNLAGDISNANIFVFPPKGIVILHQNYTSGSYRTAVANVRKLKSRRTTEVGLEIGGRCIQVSYQCTLWSSGYPVYNSPELTM